MDVGARRLHDELDGPTTVITRAWPDGLQCSGCSRLARRAPARPRPASKIAWYSVPSAAPLGRGRWAWSGQGLPGAPMRSAASPLAGPVGVPRIVKCPGRPIVMQNATSATAPIELLQGIIFAPCGRRRCFRRASRLRGRLRPAKEQYHIMRQVCRAGAPDQRPVPRGRFLCRGCGTSGPREPWRKRCRQDLGRPSGGAARPTAAAHLYRPARAA